MSKFQVALLGVFGFFIILAVLVFALYRGSSSGQEAKVTVWGSFPAHEFSLFLSGAGFTEAGPVSVNYVERPAASLESDFTEALARDRGPDLILLREDQFWKNKEKLLPIPYESIGERDFQQTFAEAGEIFLTGKGIYALPLAIDPLILYYNRDLLSGAGIAKPFTFWSEIYTSTANLTRRDPAGNLVQSAVALGETRNINNAKDLLALLMLQAGTPITSFMGETLRSSMAEGFSLPTRPADSALEFYTQFSNPTKSFYSWNRTLPEAQTRFTAGDLAYYVGFASEFRALKNKNPTLNFSVAGVPQSRDSGQVVTLGRVYGVSISRGTKNAAAALTAALKLVGRESAVTFSNITLIPPARRDLLSLKPTDSVLPIFYTSALQAKSWVDPDAAGTEKLFSEMVEAVTSGRARTSEAVSETSRKLEALIKN